MSRDAVVHGPYLPHNAVQHMLRQPVGLSILPVHIDLCAVNIRIDIGVAVDAHKIVRRPAVGSAHSGGQAGGIIGTENFIRRIAA